MWGETYAEMEEIKRYEKEKHAERVAKTPSRIEYAVKQFEANGINNFSVRNSANGHIHVYDNNNIVHQFWASTGKIMLNPKIKPYNDKALLKYYNVRGIDNFIKAIKIINKKR